MIDEVREYVAAPGKLPALIERFNKHAFRLFAKHGMEVVQIGMTSVGDNSFNEIVYTLRFENLAELDAKWTALLADQEAISIFTETEVDGPLIQSIRRRLLITDPFSTREVR
jgi:hypothetical protein